MAGRVYLEILWGRPVNILHRSLIFDASQVGDDIRINCFTSLVRLASGILIAGWQSGRACSGGRWRGDRGEGHSHALVLR